MKQLYITLQIGREELYITHDSTYDKCVKIEMLLIQL